MATDFVNTKYEADNGLIYRIKVDTATLSNNAAPAADADTPVFARVGGGRRGTGLRARGLRLVKPGATSTEKSQTTFYPILQKTVFAALVTGAAFAGKPGYNIEAKIPEYPVS